ncbi:GerMN domain-containing protein [Crassaminicella thermophila]|uniref:GerMN domain-containing protein n=1 Tax=Crassaminicella thermophila TaxID=2599308 RepID=UPI00143CE21F|nr:GerMN domain-containing protein [Crassaminicella thermophila]
MRILYKVLILLLLVIALTYALTNIRHNDDFNKNQIPIAPVPDKRRYELKLYFGNPQNDALTVERRVIVSSEQREEKLIVEELIKGPRNKILNTFIPKQTRIISINTIEGICYVNFSKEILNNPWRKINEDMMIWSVVNSLTEVEYIHAVQILVEGNKDVFEKIYSLKEPLYRNEKVLMDKVITPIDTFTRFIEYLKTDNYQKAYKMLDKSSKENLDFVKFKLIIGNYAKQMKNYHIYMYQTQKYSSGVVLVINFRKTTISISDEEDEMIEKWKLIYENGLWKIVLPI